MPNQLSVLNKGKPAYFSQRRENCNWSRYEPTTLVMGEKSSNKSHKLTCVYGVSGFNILLTFVTVGYLSYSVYLLNNRVFVLEGKLTQTENSKNGKRVARSSSWEYVKKPCEECKRVCSSMLGKTEKKVSLQSVCFALFSFSLCLNDQRT